MREIISFFSVPIWRHWIFSNMNTNVPRHCDTRQYMLLVIQVNSTPIGDTITDNLPFRDKKSGRLVNLIRWILRKLFHFRSQIKSKTKSVHCCWCNESGISLAHSDCQNENTRLFHYDAFDFVCESESNWKHLIWFAYSNRSLIRIREQCMCVCWMYVITWGGNEAAGAQSIWCSVLRATMASAPAKVNSPERITFFSVRFDGEIAYEIRIKAIKT